MSERNNKTRQEMKFDVMDVRDLTYQTEHFDLVIDKSTIDAVLCGNAAFYNVALMLKEC